MERTKPIKSVKDPADPHPWYDVGINNGLPEIVTDNDGGTNFDLAGVAASTPSWSSLATPPAKAMVVDVVYGVTESGDFIAWEHGTDLANHGISLRAHLAWYDATTDEFTILDFVEK